MHTQLEPQLEAQLQPRIRAGFAYRSVRARVISLLGPVTALGGLAWAIAQPYRLTLLHPHHQGVWWLLVEPPLLVAGAGIFFSLVIAAPLIADIEDRGGAAR